MAKGVALVSRLPYAFILFFSVFVATSLWANGSFDEINREYVLFKGDFKAQKYRHNYEKLIARFNSFAKKSQNAASAPKALLKIANLSEDIAVITRSKDDFKTAQRAYLVVIGHYEKDVAVDEALFSAVSIELEIFKDKNEATKLLEQFLSNDAANVKLYKRSHTLLNKLKSSNLVNSANINNGSEQELTQSIIKGVSFHKAGSKSQIIIEGFSKNSFSQGEIKRNKDFPRRIFFDLASAKLEKDHQEVIEVNDPAIFKIRVGKPKSNVIRIVVELGDDVNFEVSPGDNKMIVNFISPNKSEIRVVASDTFVTPRLIKKADVYKPKIIVLDPGHGGDDPGAIGARGLREKNVTLQIAQQIKTRLEKELPNIKVYLTRNRDQTLSLSKRTEMANNLEADLFISIHANAAPNRHAQGIETYYLNISHDRYAIRLAARENSMSETEVSNLEFILADLAMKNNVTDSIRLGNIVQSSMFSKVREKWHDAKDLGLKHALFFVLLGTKMPAILIETSFISNRVEEKRLKSSAYQRALAQGVVKGVKSYIEGRQAMNFQ
ncbi:MAG: N-acetylmuramoyl-L-alanine amidase [bacterium]|nr:N-acetylmuramoyl-L-alanine amidase [bacterium]